MKTFVLCLILLSGGKEVEQQQQQWPRAHFVVKNLKHRHCICLADCPSFKSCHKHFGNFEIEHSKQRGDKIKCPEH